MKAALLLLLIPFAGCVRINSPSYMSASAGVSVGSQGEQKIEAPKYPEEIHYHGLTNPFKRRDAE